MDAYETTVTLGLALYLNGTPKNIRETAGRLWADADPRARIVLSQVLAAKDPVKFVHEAVEAVESYIDWLAEQQT